MTQKPQLAVDATDLTKTFRTAGNKQVPAVRGLDLQIAPGEIVAFLGPNGAGKTTTLDMMLGLTNPTSGHVSVLGLAPRAAIDAGRVSAVLQTGGLLADVTVRETVQLIASTYRTHAGVDAVIDRAGLTRLASRRVSKCSGGEQQRLRFALALLPDPDLLILDEPTAGMDVTARHEFWDTMRADADSGRTVIFATHYLEEADTFADRIVLIAAGKVIADGPTAEIRAAAGARTVSATFDEADLQPALDAISGFAGVDTASIRGNRIVVRAANSDALAIELLTRLRGRELEVQSANLDEAFMNLTDNAGADR